MSGPQVQDLFREHALRCASRAQAQRP
jgi:hypothetical protein